MSSSSVSETKPLVSIVMPTFNQEGFIAKACASVLAQTYSNWELIIVNNFSTDKTKDVVESFNDPRLKLVEFANQGVIAASRNVGIRASCGELIAFLDSDDYWEPKKLETCLEKLSADYDLVCHGEYFFKDGSENFIPTKYGPESNCHFEHLLTHGNCLSTSAIVVKKSILDQIGLFDENKDLITAEDFDLWLRVAESKAKIGIIDDMLGYYRLHSTSASASNLRNARATLGVLRKNARDGKIGYLTRFMAALYRARIRFFILRANA